MNGFAQPVVEKINSRSLYTARSLRGWATITLFNPGSSLFENNSNNNNNNIKTIQNFIQRFKKIDYLQIQEYEILKIIYTLCTFFLCTKENCRKMTTQRLLITIIKASKS